MARKYIEPNNDVENAPPQTSPQKTSQQPAKRQSATNHDREKRVLFGTNVFNKTKASGNMRSLPAHDSLTARESSRATLDIREPLSSINDWPSPEKLIRATPARRAKTQSVARRPSGRAASPVTSDSEDDIWCDARSGCSSFSESSGSESDFGCSPVRQPSEKLRTSSPRKKTSLDAQVKVKVKSNSDLGLDLLVKGTKALHIHPRPRTASRPDTNQIQSPSPDMGSGQSTPEQRHPTLDMHMLHDDQYAGEAFSDPPASPTPSSDRPITPPPVSPTKKLKSPSKRLPPVPDQPGRPSNDAFWDPAHVNEWNELYSPTKPLFSPRKKIDDSPVRPFPLTSPRKSRNEIAAARAWDETKVKLAQDLLAQLDARLTHGAVAAATAAKGGVELVWSKTLRRTAGRAHWKRLGPGHTGRAHIELAAKILTDEARLRCTLAHEFCHLAVYVVDKVTNRPHGAEFKAWGRKVEAAFPDIRVTTKHSYTIETKFVWACEGQGCGQEYGRQSRSIDPSRHRCGRCRGMLVQIKPVPRQGLNGFAEFVKSRFKEVRQEMIEGGVAVKHADVMEELGRRWRASKAELQSGEDSSVDSMEGSDGEVVDLDE